MGWLQWGESSSASLGRLAPFGVVGSRNTRYYIASEDESEYDQVHTNIGLELVTEDSSFTLTWQQRVEEDSLRVASVETVKLRGTFTPAALYWDINDEQRTLTLHFDPHQAEGKLRFDNGVIETLMVWMRTVSFNHLCAVSPLDPDEQIPKGTLSMAFTETGEQVEIEFTEVSSNNKARQLQVCYDRRKSLELRGVQDGKRWATLMNTFPE